MLRRLLDPGHTLHALRHGPFRWWLVERMVGSHTWAMRAVARGWLVYQLTGSAFSLAWVEALRFVAGVIVSPFAGVVCDRIEKRLVMRGVRLFLVFTNLALAILIFLGVLNLWHIIVISLLEAIAYSIMEPALQGLLPELVDREALLSATSTMFVAEGVLHIVGAAAAGALISSVGAGWVFLLNAPAFALAAYALNRMPPGLRATDTGRSATSEFVAGLRYLVASPVLLILLALAYSRLLFTQPYNAFLAAFASGLGFDATGLGLLSSAAGMGALASSIIIAALGNSRQKGMLLLLSGTGAAASIVALMASGGRISPFLLVVLAGVFANGADVFTRTLIPLACDPSYRGRVVGAAMILSNLISLCVLPAGVLADAYGVPLIVGTLAGVAVVTHLAAAVPPRIRKLA